MSDSLKISIIIPTYARPSSLSACLSSLEQQTVSPHEVIVIVDGGITPEVQEAVDTFKRKGKLAIVQITNTERKGAQQSMNIGKGAATGDVIAFLDDDVTLVPIWVEEIIKGYDENRDAVGVGGRVIDMVPFVDNLFYRLYSRAKAYLFGWKMGKVNFIGMPYADLFAPSKGYLRVDYLCGGNMSFRREIIASHRFDDSLNYVDDLYLGVMLTRKEKKTLIYNSQAIVYHHRDAAGGCGRGTERIYSSFRGHTIYLLRNFNLKYLRIAVFYIYVLIYSVINRSFIYLKAISDGISQYKKFYSTASDS